MTTTNCDEENGMASCKTEEVDIQPQLLSMAKGIVHPVLHLPKTSSKFADKEFSKDINSSTWLTGDIPYVSHEYRRPRTAYEVNGADISAIASRIFYSNKIRSIHAVYDGAISNCETPSHTKFTIKLLRLSESTDIILVDVRRRAGCSVVFRDEYKAIFRAANYGEIIPRKVPRGMTISFAEVEREHGNYIPLEEERIERSLKLSMTHLTSEMHDTRVLTLQELQLTTDPSLLETSHVASKLIVTEYHKIFEYIVDDILKQVDYDDLDEDDDGGDSEEYLRSLTLNILGNILSSVSDNALLSLMYQHQCTVSMIRSLLWYVSKAQTYPWNSCLAAKCLRLLASTSSEVISQIGMEGYMLLKNAEKVGKCSYQLLEKEARATLIVTDIFAST